jgi:hypothetical protein
MLGAAGVASLPLAVLSVIVFPIVVPAVLLLVAFGRATTRGPTGTAPRRVAAFVTPVVLLVAASSVLVFGMQPYTYTYATGGESGSYVTAVHGGLAVGLVVVSLTLVLAPP